MDLPDAESGANFLLEAGSISSGLFVADSSHKIPARTQSALVFYLCKVVSIYRAKPPRRAVLSLQGIPVKRRRQWKRVSFVWQHPLS